MLRRPGGVPTGGGGGGVGGGDYQSPYAKGAGAGAGGYGGGYASPAAPNSGGSYSGGYAGASPVPPPPFGGTSGAYGGSDSYNGSSSGGGGYGGGSGYGGSSNNGRNSSSSSTNNNTQNPFGSSMYKDKRRNSGTNALQKMIHKLKDPTIWPIITTIIFAALTLYYRSKFTTVLKIMNLKSNSGTKEIRAAWENIHGNHATKERVLTNVHEQHSSTTKRLQECERSKNPIIRERDEFRVKSERLQQQLSKLSSSSQPGKDMNSNATAGGSHNHHQLLATHIQREKVYRDQLALLQNATQTDSRRAVIEKFGAGPHYVELTVELPVVGQEDTWKRGTFTFEMAPLSMMPHSIHLFLQQVTHGLWNNGWFYINGPHVLQAGPQADDAALELAYEIAHEKHGDNMDEIDERTIALEPFKEKGLAHLSFQEYSIQYPHTEWTVGYTGRPGGPDFYINKIDNSLSHGPGGQKHHVDTPDTADACFARLYSGFRTIEELTHIPTVQDDASYKNFYEEPIHIVSAKILQYPPTQTLVDMQYLKYTPEQIKLKEASQVHQLQQLQQQQLLSQQQQQQQQANVGMNTNNNNIPQQLQQQGVNVGTGAGVGVGVGVGMGAGGMNQQDVVGMGVGQQQQQQMLQQPLYGSLNDGQHQQINNNNMVDPQYGQGQGQGQGQEQYYHHNQQQQQQHQNHHHDRHKFKSHGNMADMVDA